MSHSLERINQYLHIEQEPEPKDGGSPPAYWPASGELRVENLSARYSPEGPKILEDVSFHVKAGERVGIGPFIIFLQPRVPDMTSNLSSWQDRCRLVLVSDSCLLFYAMFLLIRKVEHRSRSAEGAQDVWKSIL